MNSAETLHFIQEHFSDGIVLVIGAGLSAAEGMSGMGELASYLQAKASELAGEDAVGWQRVQAVLKAGEGLEAALLKHPPTASLEAWVQAKICELLLPEERAVVTEVLKGKRVLRLTKLVLFTERYG